MAQSPGAQRPPGAMRPPRSVSFNDRVEVASPPKSAAERRFGDAIAQVNANMMSPNGRNLSPPLRHRGAKEVTANPTTPRYGHRGGGLTPVLVVSDGGQQQSPSQSSPGKVWNTGADLPHDRLVVEHEAGERTSTAGSQGLNSATSVFPRIDVRWLREDEADFGSGYFYVNKRGMQPHNSIQPALNMHEVLGKPVASQYNTYALPSLPTEKASAVEHLHHPAEGTTIKRPLVGRMPQPAINLRSSAQARVWAKVRELQSDATLRDALEERLAETRTAEAAPSTNHVMMNKYYTCRNLGDPLHIELWADRHSQRATNAIQKRDQTLRNRLEKAMTNSLEVKHQRLMKERLERERKATLKDRQSKWLAGLHANAIFRLWLKEARDAHYRREEEAKMREAALKLQKVSRGWLMRRYNKKLEAAKRVIGPYMRGYLVRRRLRERAKAAATISQFLVHTCTSNPLVDGIRRLRWAVQTMQRYIRRFETQLFAKRAVLLLQWRRWESGHQQRVVKMIECNVELTNAVTPDSVISDKNWGLVPFKVKKMVVATHLHDVMRMIAQRKVDRNQKIGVVEAHKMERMGVLKAKVLITGGNPEDDPEYAKILKDAEDAMPPPPKHTKWLLDSRGISKLHLRGMELAASMPAEELYGHLGSLAVPRAAQEADVLEGACDNKEEFERMETLRSAYGMSIMPSQAQAGGPSLTPVLSGRTTPNTDARNSPRLAVLGLPDETTGLG